LKKEAKKMSIWLGAGGGAWSITDETCQKLAALGVRDVHCVSLDLSTQTAALTNIKKHGMTPTFDVEIPLWVNTNMNPYADISYVGPQLQGLKAAGWRYFASEGLGKAQVNIIRSVLPFINYGSEDGSDMYAGMYNHDSDAHFANLLESYHKGAIPMYQASAQSAWSKCKNFGITFQMYAPTSDLETDLAAVEQYLTAFKGMGITISEVLLWSGEASDIAMVFNSPWADIINLLKRIFGLRTDPAWSTI
jgi:hypothetical protein